MNCLDVLKPRAAAIVPAPLGAKQTLRLYDEIVNPLWRESRGAQDIVDDNV
jgi:hypothetical protein